MNNVIPVDFKNKRKLENMEDLDMIVVEFDENSEVYQKYLEWKESGRL